MAKVTFSITSTRGTASLTIYDAADINATQQSIFIEDSFPEALPISTAVRHSIVGGAITNGFQVDRPLVWAGVTAYLTETDYLTMKAIAVKSDKERQDGGSVEIVMGDEFYKFVEDAASNSRAIATGGTNAIGSTGSIWYYAAYNVVIVNFETEGTNLFSDGGQRFRVSFDIVELDKRTP